MSRADDARLLALIRIEASPTPAERLEAINAAVEAGHMTKAQARDVLEGTTSLLTVAFVGVPVELEAARETDKRRALQTLRGAQKDLGEVTHFAIIGGSGKVCASTVGAIRSALADYEAALERVLELHAGGEE